MLALFFLVANGEKCDEWNVVLKVRTAFKTGWKLSLIRNYGKEKEKMKNQIKKTFSLFLVLALVFGMMVPAVTTVYAAGDGEQVVYRKGDTAYTVSTAIGSLEESWKFVDDGGGEDAAYCANQNLSPNSDDTPSAFGGIASPGLNYRLKYRWDTAWGDSTLQAFIFNQNSAGDAGKSKEQIARLLYAGYPYNGAGLQGSIEDAEFYIVTQAAFYKYTAGDPLWNFSAEGNAAVDALIAAADDTSIQLPSDYEVYIYFVDKPYQGEYYWQNLVNLECTPEDNSPEPVTPTVKTKVNPNEIEAAPDQTFVDTVTLTGLQEGVEYTITGKLMDKAEQAEVTATCEPYTFTATAEDAAAESVEKEMTFTVDASELAGKELVVFETLSWTVDGEGKSVEHNDFDDSDQTVTVKEKTEEPKVPTVTTKVSPNEIEAKPNQTFIDTVILTNLQEGVEYTITGKLMDKAEQAEVTATCEPITFVATAEDAAAESVEKEMEFTVDATEFAEKELVVFETLSWTVDGEEKSVEHNDYDDADQTVTVKKAPSAPGTPGEEEVGQFTVKKTVDASADAETVFEITVFFQYPDGETKEEVIKISSMDDPVLFEKVPAGTKVTISEDAPGYQMTCKVGEEVTTEFTIANGDNLEVVVNNSFVPEVPKDLGGEEPEATPEDTPEDTPEQKPATPTEQTTGGQKETKPSTSKNPKTGDESDMALWLVLGLGAASALTIAAKRRNA